MSIGYRKGRNFLALFLAFVLLLSTVSLEALLTAKPVYGNTTTALTLTDIDSSYAREEIAELVKRGIVAGYEDGSFAPAKPITRAEFAKLLTAAMGLQPRPDQAKPFSDVAENSWYRGYVGALVASGITQGTSESAFSPDAYVTREQMIVFFIRAFGMEQDALQWKSDAAWTDAEQISDWARAYVDFGARIGFVGGIQNADGSLRFGPLEHAERQAVARLAFEFVENAATYVEQAVQLTEGGNKPSPTPTPTPAASASPSSSPTAEPVVTPGPVETPTPVETPAPPLEIVRDGQANAVIVVAADADERTQAAATTLAEYVQKSTGSLLPLMTGEPEDSGNGEPDNRVRIYVGAAAEQDAPRLDELLQGMDGDGYVILSRDNRIAVSGPTSWGTEYGVYEFLEKYVGVRWLMPGADGEDVPQITDLSVPVQEVKEEPAFISRVFSPLNGETYPVQAAWARKNRMHSRISFHHNIYSLFPPAEFGQTHPEFYPVRNGVQYIPSDTLTNSWQPCFSEPGTIDVAINKIIAYFADNPDADSFSLGVNDGKGYCETEPDHELYTGKINSVGVLDMSDIYYNWVNQVAEGVLAVYPDKWFGLLAYDSVMDPPSFRLNSRVVPFITQDRMSWIDAEVESQSKQKLEQWNEVADHIAWYDYIYGNPYLLPRMYTGKMADNYAYASEHGVLAHYAELYPNWGEGPKPWIAAKLQWNPDQDVDALMDEWLERAVGEEAAADLRTYYDHWEQFWTERVKDSPWFDSRKRTTYLEFGDPGYLSLVTEQEIAYSRSLLEAVVAKADTAGQKARAELLLRAFEYYEASALSYTPKYESMNEQDALALLNPAAMERKMDNARVRYELLDEFAQNPVLMHYIKPSPTGIYYPMLHWNGLDSEAFWGLADYMKQFEPSGGTVSDQVYGLTQYEGNAKLRNYADLLQNVNLELFALNNNFSFELGGDVPLSWASWYESNTVYQRSTDYSHTGDSSMMISTLRRGGPHQVVNVNPGMMASRIHYFTVEGTQTNATIQITFNLRNAAGTQIGTLVSETKKVGATAGEWASVDFLTEIPEGVKSVQMIVLLNQVEPETKLYLDDFVIYQGSEEWLNAQSFWKFADYIQQHEPNGGPLTNRVEALVGSSESAEERQFAQLLLDVLNDAEPITLNASFEQGTGTSAPPWSFFVQGQGSVTRVTDTAHLGSSSILVTGAKPSAVPYQYFIPKTGPIAAKVYYKLPEGMTTAGTIQIGFNLNTSTGQGITVMRSEIRPLSGSPGEWASINLAAYIPAEFNGLVVGRIQFTINVSNLESETQIYVDDANVYQ